jgi:hypothetical protein
MGCPSNMWGAGVCVHVVLLPVLSLRTAQMASMELGDFGICHRLMSLAADPDNQAFIIKEKGA